MTASVEVSPIWVALANWVYDELTEHTSWSLTWDGLKCLNLRVPGMGLVTAYLSSRFAADAVFRTSSFSIYHCDRLWLGLQSERNSLHPLGSLCLASCNARLTFLLHHLCHPPIPSHVMSQRSSTQRCIRSHVHEAADFTVCIRFWIVIQSHQTSSICAAPYLNQDAVSSVNGRRPHLRHRCATPLEQFADKRHLCQDTPSI